MTEADRALWDRVARTVARRAGRDASPPEPPAAAPRAPSPLSAPPPPATAPGLAPFRLGETAAPRPAPHALAPGVRAELLAAPLAMDKRTHRALSRGKLRPEGRIDLHGLTLAHAEPALRQFVIASHDAGRRLVLVITGKGGRGAEEWPIPVAPGALKRQVPHWLHRPPLAGLVQQVVPAHRRHGGDGAFYVYLRRRR